MNFLLLNNEQIYKTKPRLSHVVISTFEQKLNIPENFMRLDNIDFTENDFCYENILSFINKHYPKISLIVCHYDTQLNKSTAILMSLSKILNKSEKKLLKKYPKYDKEIYEIIMNLYKEKKDSYIWNNI